MARPLRDGSRVPRPCRPTRHPGCCPPRGELKAVGGSCRGCGSGDGVVAWPHSCRASLAARRKPANCRGVRPPESNRTRPGRPEHGFSDPTRHHRPRVARGHRQAVPVRPEVPIVRHHDHQAAGCDAGAVLRHRGFRFASSLFATASARRAAGRTVAPADCQIAAIARSRGMAVATRNGRDYKMSRSRSLMGGRVHERDVGIALSHHQSGGTLSRSSA